MDHVSTLNSIKPFYLFIGRKRQKIVKPFRFEATNEIADMGDEDLPHHVLLATTYKLFIDDKLFASVTVYPRQRYSRAPISLRKPKRGPIEFHLVKKYVTIH